MSYYQLAKIKSEISGTPPQVANVFQKAYERDLNPNTIDIDANNKFIALQLNPENLLKFDDLIKDLNIDNIIFSTLDFENIIDYAFKNNIKIRHAETNLVDENELEEFNELIKKRNSGDLEKFLIKDNVDINILELLFENTILRIYDSGIFWIDREFSQSESIPQLFFKSILKAVV